MCAVHKHRYLFWLASDMLQFRLSEFRAVFDTVKLAHHSWHDALLENNFPFIVLQLDCEPVARHLAQRATAVHALYRLWSHARTRQHLHAQMASQSLGELDGGFRCNKSFKIVVESFQCALSSRTQLQRINDLSYLPLNGPVSLKNPEFSLYYIEQYKHANDKADNVENIEANCPDDNRERLPSIVYFGRWLCAGNRSLITRHSLKTRIYIGNTSLDPQLALIMANLAGVRAGSLILDPFVGTGSTLVAAAALGGHVTGSDIDYLTVHARTRATRAQCRQRARDSTESVAANFAQYGLQSRLTDVLVADAALLQRLWRNTLQFDAILADPPYGIRESNLRLGVDKCRASGDSETDTDDEPSSPSLSAKMKKVHFPAKTCYRPHQLFGDLLQLAAERLCLHGRLAVWFPSLTAEFSTQQFPQHSCLRLLFNCEQPLTRYASRHLLVFEKWREPKLSSDLAPSVTDSPATNGACVDHNLDQFSQRFFQMKRELRLQRCASKSGSD